MGAWTYAHSGGYPEIILHDCCVTGMQIEGDRLRLVFADGFWITPGHRDNPYGKLLRTGGSEIVYDGLEPEHCCAHVFRERRGRSRAVYRKIPWNELVRLVNGGGWSLELVDEFYRWSGALLRGYIQLERKAYHMECEMLLRYREASYRWNGIREDREW